jgi:two-component system, cell cycle response regulator DivK
MEHRTVLIIDDCRHEREIFARYLEFVGGNVLEAGDGEEGLRVARDQLPDLILLDLTMPVRDGWETIACLREDPETAGIPVIALTALHLPWERLEAAGFCGYLEKPIVPNRVLEDVERCIGRLDLSWSDLRSTGRLTGATAVAARSRLRSPTEASSRAGS